MRCGILGLSRIFSSPSERACRCTFVHVGDGLPNLSYLVGGVALRSLWQLARPFAAQVAGFAPSRHHLLADLAAVDKRDMVG